MKEIDKNVTGAMIRDKVNQWRKDMVEDYNNTYAGGSFLDSKLVASYILGNTKDIQVMMQWIELLAGRIDKLEAELELPTPPQQ